MHQLCVNSSGPPRVQKSQYSACKTQQHGSSHFISPGKEFPALTLPREVCDEVANYVSLTEAGTKSTQVTLWNVRQNPSPGILLGFSKPHFPTPSQEVPGGSLEPPGLPRKEGPERWFPRSSPCASGGPRIPKHSPQALNSG